MKTLLVLLVVLGVLGGGGYAGWQFLQQQKANDPLQAAEGLKDLRLGQSVEDIQFELGKRLEHSAAEPFEVYVYPVTLPPAEGDAAADAGAGAGAAAGAGAGAAAAAGAGAGAGAAAAAAAAPARPAIHLYAKGVAVQAIAYLCAAEHDSTALDKLHCGQTLADIRKTYAGTELTQWCRADDVLQRYIDLPVQGKSFFLQRNQIAELWVRRGLKTAPFLNGERWTRCGHASSKS